MKGLGAFVLRMSHKSVTIYFLILLVQSLYKTTARNVILFALLDELEPEIMESRGLGGRLGQNFRIALFQNVILLEQRPKGSRFVLKDPL